MNACLHLINATAGSWVSPLHFSNPKLFPFPLPEFIPHPLIYVSTDSPFIRRSLFWTKKKQDTPLLFFFLGLIRLFEGLSLAKIIGLDKHSTLCVWLVAGCHNKSNIHVVTQSIETPLKMRQTILKILWFFFCFLVVSYSLYIVCFCGSLADNELLLFACCLLLM